MLGGGGTARAALGRGRPSWAPGSPSTPAGRRPPTSCDRWRRRSASSSPARPGRPRGGACGADVGHLDGAEGRRRRAGRRGRWRPGRGAVRRDLRPVADPAGRAAARRPAARSCPASTCCWRRRCASSSCSPGYRRRSRRCGPHCGRRPPARMRRAAAVPDSASVLRWLTAGESHGPALVAILEGVPAGVEVTSADDRRASWPAAASATAGARGCRSSRTRSRSSAALRHGLHAGQPGRDPGRQHRVAQVADGDGGRPGRPRRARRAGPQRAADPAPPGPRRPGRHAEVRRTPTPGRSWSGPAPGRPPPGSPSAPSPRRCCSQALGIEIVSHVVELGQRRGQAGPAARPRGRRAHRRRPAALPRPGGERPDGRRGRRGQEGRRHPRRHRRGAGLRRTAGPGQPRAVGPQARRPAGRRADVDPGDQGRGDRRRVHPGPLARLAGARRDRADRRPASAGSPTGPAAWRAASPPASRCGCAPR